MDVLCNRKESQGMVFSSHMIIFIEVPPFSMVHTCKIIQKIIKKCICDWETNKCSYQKRKKGAKAKIFVPFDPTEEENFSKCKGQMGQGPSVPTPTKPPPGTLIGEWSNWSPWSVCSAACGHGHQTRIRSCSTQYCDGQNIEYKICYYAYVGFCGGCPLEWGDFQQDFQNSCNYSKKECGFSIDYLNNSDYGLFKIMADKTNSLLVPYWK